MEVRKSIICNGVFGVEYICMVLVKENFSFKFNLFVDILSKRVLVIQLKHLRRLSVHVSFT